MIQSSSIIWMEYGNVDHLYWSCFNDSRVNFLLMKSCTLHRVVVSQGTSIICSRFELWQPFKAISREPKHQPEYLQNVSSSNSEKKAEDNTKKWKRFLVSLDRCELDYVSNFTIIDKLVLKLLMSIRVSQEYGVLQLSY